MPFHLAKRLLKEMETPPGRRTLRDDENLLNHIRDAQFFDVTGIQDAAIDLANDMGKKDRDLPRTARLPAYKTFLEQGALVGAHFIRKGYYLGAVNNELNAGIVIEATACKSLDVFGLTPLGTFDYSDINTPILRMRRDTIDTLNRAHDHFEGVMPAEIFGTADAIRAPSEQLSFELRYFIPSFLALINTPRLTSRRVRHQYFRKSRHRLKKSAPGKYPLRAWTEITIHIDGDVHQDPTVKGSLTGRRALHHVRTFWRWRLDKLEMVRPHWRGDPALGMVRHRYKVEHRPESERRP